MLITRYNYGGQIKECEMRRAYTLHGGDERYVHNFSPNTWRKETTRKT